MVVFKMVSPVHIWVFCLLCLTVAGQESVNLLHLHDTTPSSVHPVAVSVKEDDLTELSRNVLIAEAWLRNNVLAHYPSTKITTIVVHKPDLCKNGGKQDMGIIVIILKVLKNIYHSLTRWGLENDIKVSIALPSNCLDLDSGLALDDSFENVLKPVLVFLQSINSTYSVFEPDEVFDLGFDRMSLMKMVGSFEFGKFNLIIKERKPITRKLSAMDDKNVHPYPYPARPTPLPDISPFHSSIGYSTPANIPKTPQSPKPIADSPPPPPQPTPTISFPFPSSPPSSIVDSPPPTSFPFPSSPPSSSSIVDSPPPFSFPFPSPSFSTPPIQFPASPALPPELGPASSPYGFTLPPCNPDYATAPTPTPRGALQEMWCVAKPSVPAEHLQEGMDYACGEGGGDCDEIMAHGNCFYPDTVVAHASYAFNSYWQKNKRNGGSCSFGGTAMLINADPSFLHCRFPLN